MIESYSYTPSIWPSVLTAVLLIILAVYAWRRRSVPGALPFTIGCLFAALWAAGAVLEIAAVELQTKIFWYEMQGAMILPTATASICFVLEYAWPGRWLNRKTLILLSIPCLLALGMILTNNRFHLSWRGFEYDGALVPVRGSGNWLFMAYGYALSLVNLIVFAWLFIRSPQHRWPVAIMLVGMLGARLQYLLEATRVLPPDLPLDVPPVTFEYLIYAIALFGFHIFDPLPLARQAVIAQMREGALVLDPQGRVAGLNPAAELIFKAPASYLKGRPIEELLPDGTDGKLSAAQEAEIELSLGAGPALRSYVLETSLLKDWRGLDVGCLLLLHDVTEQKRAQAQIMEQQRALAALQERELVARELHDGLGQVLAYVRVQAQAARDWLAQDQEAAADSSLEKLVAVAQDAQTDVREYILGARSAITAQTGFLPALQCYLQDFSRLYSLRTELVAPADWADDLLDPTAEAQLLRIIQEALTNARKHARAECVEVVLQYDTDYARVVVQDDGVGFDPALLGNEERQKYGLGFMRERAAGVNGSVDIQSAPGQGTRVIVGVPLKQQK
jgi:signal transduction histidine kinase